VTVEAETPYRISTSAGKIHFLAVIFRRSVNIFHPGAPPPAIKKNGYITCTIDITGTPEAVLMALLEPAHSNDKAVLFLWQRQPAIYTIAAIGQQYIPSLSVL
jgi:hypothetical protein